MLQIPMQRFLVIAVALCSLGIAGASRWPRLSSGAPQVTLVADGGMREIPTESATVADLLSALGMTLGPLDRTDPSPDTPITDGLEVRVTRVARRDITEETTLHANTFVLADPDRPLGHVRVLVQGRDGLLRRVWRVWEKDGEVASRVLLDEQLTSEPRDSVVLRGIRGMSTRSGYWRHWRTPMDMEATAYDPGPRSCGKWATGYTATGIKAEKGIVAVDDQVIPLGTRLYIPGYGFALAADRGSAIKGMRIDLCFPTYQEAIRFGRRRVKVYRLD